MAISAPPGKGRARGSVRAVCVCERERERERRRAEPGGGRGRGRGSAPVCGSERGVCERCRQPPGFPAARSCQARSESLLGLAGCSGGEWRQCHARLGGDGDPFAGAFQSNLGLALAVELEGEGGDSPA